MSKTKRRKPRKRRRDLRAVAARGGSVCVTDGVDFTCPFCKAHCTASLELYAVMHALPMCEKFEQLSPDEFLKAVNERLAN